ncbi:MAG: hypothetical protein Q7T36_12710 [Fluviicoccus sp.]|uniref:Flp family type IVb pilin n=1 Tax=Fluviicoccus sp. TaxID=2003552 RepID=UPI002724CFB3|nr:hypothetical protein [Fluviicoccus sp.]MDO8331322.1 hypothetical protein [Fluviicoccus sp.]
MLKFNQRGQGMTEYIIIVALIAVAAIGAFRFFGQTVRTQAAVAANEIGGNDNGAARAGVRAAAGATTVEALRSKTLSNYEVGNR